jgi:hypothetical protein
MLNLYKHLSLKIIINIVIQMISHLNVSYI